MQLLWDLKHSKTLHGLCCCRGLIAYLLFEDGVCALLQVVQAHAALSSATPPRSSGGRCC